VALYALLVGIDDYRAPVTPLGGCRNDIDAVGAFLQSRLPAGEFMPLRLADGEASRAAVIDGFRRHLGRAGSGDSVLFWFSGHGSQEPVPAEFARLEPTGMLQTLVCADSRRDGVPDLYDKELALLIGEITARGAHAVAVLDCCHAESGTRGPDAALAVRGQPPLESPSRAGVLLNVEAALRDLAPAPPAAAPHVLLAACHSDQYAIEVPTAEGTRGLFSVALLELLEILGFGATCRELMTGARCRVEDGARGQVPVLSPAADAVVDRPFLGGGVRAARSPVTMRWLRGAWEIDAGACHGVPSGTRQDPAVFTVHDSEPPLEVRVSRVLTERSEVAPVGWTPDPGERYPVVLTGVPLPVGTVALDGGPGDQGQLTTRLLAAALDTVGPAGGPSPHVRVTDPAVDAGLRSSIDVTNTPVDTARPLARAMTRGMGTFWPATPR